MYVKRHAEQTVDKFAKMFGAVLVVGPRQVGKTAMLQNITQGITYATLDDLILRASAQEESGTFFKDYPPPVFVDEIQKAPELFAQIKIILDRDHKKGQFFMCSPQQFQMMKGVSESLAGRISLVTLLGFSLRESHQIDFTMPFLPTEDYLTARRKQLAEISYDEVWHTIHRGSMPELVNNPDFEPPLYFYRDKEMNEINLLIEDGGTLYPLEMKKHADPQKQDIDAFSLLDKIPNVKRGAGGVICLYDNLVTLKGSDRVIPVKYL